MFSQQIATSKYRTTIEIPAHRLQTKATFIQIPKQSSAQIYNQTVIVPSNGCQWKFQQYKRKQQYQTKIIIQQLQTAYQQDMNSYEQKISIFKYQRDIAKLQSDNLISNLNQQIINYKQTIKENKQKQQKLNLKILQIQSQSKSKSNNIQILQLKIQQSNKTILQLSKQNQQKSILLNTKLTDYRSSQNLKYQQKISRLKMQYQAIISKLSLQNSSYLIQLPKLKQQLFLQSTNNLNLTNNIQLLKQQKLKLRQQIQFEAKQIQQYLNKMKQLQKDILIHKQINYKQNIQIQSLLEELQKSRNFIHQFNHSNNKNQQNQNIKIINEDNIRIYQQRILSLQNDILQKQAVYLLKLKQIDELRTNLSTLQIKINKLQTQNLRYNNQLTLTKNNNQKLSIQLSSKVLEINQLVNRPLEQKVYEVKIQKMIQKKQYIIQLESQVRSLEHLVQELKATIDSYAVQLKSRSLKEQSLINQNALLLKNIDDLKKYIQKRENSVSWIVQRQIVKDVQISQHSSIQQKAKSYKVHVKNSIYSGSDQHADISLIKNTNEQVNISLGQKISTLLKSQNKNNHKNLQYNVQNYKYQNNLILGQKSKINQQHNYQ